MSNKFRNLNFADISEYEDSYSGRLPMQKRVKREEVDQKIKSKKLKQMRQLQRNSKYEFV